jgi:hypothetical protein
MKPESSATLGALPTLLPRKSNINSSRPFIQMNLASGQPLLRQDRMRPHSRSQSLVPLRQAPSSLPTLF